MNDSGYCTENDDSLIEPMVGTDSYKVSTRGGEEDNLSDKVKVDAKVEASFKDVKSSLDDSITDGVKRLRTHSSPENEKSPTVNISNIWSLICGYLVPLLGFILKILMFLNFNLCIEIFQN